MDSSSISAIQCYTLVCPRLHACCCCCLVLQASMRGSDAHVGPRRRHVDVRRAHSQMTKGSTHIEQAGLHGRAEHGTAECREYRQYCNNTTIASL